MHQQEDRSLPLKRITPILENHQQIQTRTDRGKQPKELNQVRIYYYPNADHKFQVRHHPRRSNQTSTLGCISAELLPSCLRSTKHTPKALISCYNKNPPEPRIHLILVVRTTMELMKRNQKASHSNLTCPKLPSTYNTTGISTFQIQSCNQCGGQHK